MGHTLVSAYVDCSPDFLRGVFIGIGEWEDDGVLAAVLAASQQEYLDKLKNDSQNSTVGCSKNS